MSQHTVTVEAAMQGVNLPIKSNYELSILLKGASAQSRGKNWTSDPLVTFTTELGRPQIIVL